jgi:hypothetical protein
MTTPQWQPGTLYNPGAVVRRISAPPIVAVPPYNPGFEEGDTGWDKGLGWAIVSNNDNPFSGSWTAEKSGVGTALLLNQNIVQVTPGQSITASCQVEQGASGVGGTRTEVIIQWLDQSQTLISTSTGNTVIDGSGGAWHPSTVTGIAPANAAYARIGASGNVVSGPSLWVDAFQWNYAFQASIEGLVFRAVQAEAGFSGSTEPVWPDTVGQQVIDNEVTWEAINTSTVTWEANPILVSGHTEPDFLPVVGSTVSDNESIIWRAISRRVEDERCPNTPIVAIAASKIFCADDDIIAFSATVNPLDWSTADDAGYLPFGLQTHGANPVKALGLYRSNLVAFNASGFQMWQVDQDPLNMALLDAAPIGSIYPQSIQPVQNDLAFLGGVGIRNIGIAGASTNLQAGTFGENIDQLVTAKLREGLYTPISCIIPSYGQYWLIFGDEAFVLTINDSKTLRWSRYVFPEIIVNTTLVNDDLYLRTENDAVWKLTDLEVADDVYCRPDPPVLSGVNYGDFEFQLSWTEPDTDYVCMDSYQLLRSENGGLFVLIATLDENTLEYDDTDIEPGTQYVYVVIAVPCDPWIPSLPSNEVYFPSATPPVLSLVEYGFDAELSWTEAIPAGDATVTGYALYRSVNGAAYELLGTFDYGVFEHVDADLATDTLYEYYVVALISTGSTSQSNIVQADFDISDPCIDDVVLLVHGNGTDGSTSFPDNSTFNHTLSPAGNVQVDTGTTKFAGGSIEFDGNGDYIAMVDSDAWSMGTGDFTLELWARARSLDAPAALNYPTFFSQRHPSPATSSSFLAFLANNSGGPISFVFTYYYNLAGNFISVGRQVTFNLNEWYHVAICRDGADLRLFLNGVQQGATHNIGALGIRDANSNMLIGTDTVNPTEAYWNGWMAEIRFTKCARYTSNFTPTAAPFPNP